MISAITKEVSGYYQSLTKYLLLLNRAVSRQKFSSERCSENILNNRQQLNLFWTFFQFGVHWKTIMYQQNHFSYFSEQSVIGNHRFTDDVATTMLKQIPKQAINR